ncbi:MAG: hypothetical protein AB3N15_10555 [Paracoccaceae bacterium]
MEASQDTKQTPKDKAERLVPLDEMDEDEFEELAGDAAGLIRAGYVQYWRLVGTVGAFSVGAIPDVWHLQLNFAGEIQEASVDQIKAIVSAFWEDEQPEYITAHSSVDWLCVWLMREAGFQQVGVLPLSDGPVMTWGYRKCH